MSGAIEIGPYRPGDEEAIVQGFQRTFGDARDLDEWRWRHADNPAGLQAWVARTSDGRIVSQFASVPRRVKLRDEIVTFAEIVDSFTDPDFRKGLQRPGLFVRTALPFVEHHGRPDRNVVMYGLPTPSHYRIGHRFIGYTHVDDDCLELLRRELADAEEQPDPDCGEEVRAQLVDRFSDDCQALQDEVAPRYEISTVRDAEYLNWRYASRPGSPYRLVEARECDGRLLAAIAMRHDWDGEGTTAVCDAVVRPHPAFRGLLRYVCALARCAGDRRICALFRQGSLEYDVFADAEWRPFRSHLRLVCGIYRDDIKVDDLRERWHITLGDFDVV